MRDYVIFVDSACDIACDLLNEWGVKYCTLSLVFSDDPKEYQAPNRNDTEECSADADSGSDPADDCQCQHQQAALSSTDVDSVQSQTTNEETQQ